MRVLWPAQQERILYSSSSIALEGPEKYGVSAEYSPNMFLIAVPEDLMRHNSPKSSMGQPVDDRSKWIVKPDDCVCTAPHYVANLMVVSVDDP